MYIAIQNRVDPKTIYVNFYEQRADPKTIYVNFYKQEGGDIKVPTSSKYICIIYLNNKN